MRRACLVLAGLLAVAGPVQGLALVSSGEAGLRVQVEQGSLQAAGRGNVSLDGEPLGDELEPMDAAPGPWRGLTNVTTLTPAGEGWLVLTDARSGLLVPVTEERPNPNTSQARTVNDKSEDPATTGEPDRSAENGTSPRQEQDDHAPANRSAEARSPNPTAPTPDNARPPSSGPDEASASAPREPDPSNEKSDEEALPLDPTVLVLSLLFAGAFAVERFLDSEDEDDIEWLGEDP